MRSTQTLVEIYNSGCFLQTAHLNFNSHWKKIFKKLHFWPTVEKTSEAIFCLGWISDRPIVKFVLFCLKFNSSGLQSKQVFQFQCPHKLNTQNERERVKECVCVCEREGEREREERREESYDCFIHKLRESNTTHIDFGFSCSSPLKWVLITLTKLPISHKKLYRTPAKNSTRYCYSSKTRWFKNNPSKYQRQINGQYFDYKYKFHLLWWLFDVT